MSMEQVVELVLQGETKRAIEQVRERYPQLEEKNVELIFDLLCQQFIEFIRKNQPKKAIAFAQTNLWKFAKDENLLEQLKVALTHFLFVWLAPFLCFGYSSTIFVHLLPHLLYLFRVLCLNCRFVYLLSVITNSVRTPGSSPSHRIW